MPFEPIKQLEIENYGCIRNATFELTPLHALIGPNDSGKSTVLRALRTAAQFARGQFSSERRPFDPMLDLTVRTKMTLRYADVFAYRIDAKTDGVWESVLAGNSEVATGQSFRAWNVPGILQAGTPTRNQGEAAKPLAMLRERMTSATMVRFDPDYLRQPGPLLPDTQNVAFADERGSGLASVFDALVNRDAETFGRIQQELRLLFPSIAKIGLINTSSAQKEVAVTLTNGIRIGANAMSEGLLYFLGFAALRHTAGSSLFLVEEPENGLHPSRIADVMNVLREISKTNQVVIATHSPLVINELKGHEVSVVTRDEAGTHTRLLKDTPNFEERSKVFALGELWVSYANGSDEGPLLNGGSRQ